MLDSSLTELRRRGRNSLKGKWGAAIGILLVTGLISFGIAFTFVGPLLVAGPLALGSCIFYAHCIRNEKAEFGDMFSGFSNFGNAFLAYLLQAIFITGWTLLFFIPGIIKAFSYSLTYYVLMDNPTMSGNQAITESRNLMNGYKGKMFLLQLSFIGWGLLSVLTFGILLFWLVPYMNATMAAFYDEIKNIKNPKTDEAEVLTDNSATSDPFSL